jgi:hypothetical protein
MEPGYETLPEKSHARTPGGERASSRAAGEEVRREASEVTRTARDRAASSVDEQKQRVSDLLDRLAETAESDRIGRYAAEYARRGAEYLRQRSARDLFASARSQLKSHPEVMLSACFVAGLALARFMKRDRRHQSAPAYREPFTLSPHEQGIAEIEERP